MVLADMCRALGSEGEAMGEWNQIEATTKGLCVCKAVIEGSLSMSSLERSE